MENQAAAPSQADLTPSKVTVIIPTKNRPADLRVAVATLLQQSELPRELIIVDQSSSAEAADAVARLFADAPEHLRTAVSLRYIRDEAIPGGAIARNRAMDIASGDVWLFLDDDVALEPGFIRELLRVYRDHPQTTGVSGIITNYASPPSGFRLWASVFMRGPFHDPRQPLYWNANRCRNMAPVSVDRFTGCLMSFRADAVRDHRFDENLTGVSDGEDVDFCLRLSPGSRLLLAPSARLAHNHSKSGRQTDHWLRRSARGQLYIYFRNWRHGVRNRLAYTWLMAGYSAVAAVACLRTRSSHPWHALLTGRREAIRAACHPGQRPEFRSTAR